MYRPASHKKDDLPFVINFIRKHPFAMLVIKGSELMATHIPLLIDAAHQELRLFGHIANHNEMRNYLQDETEVLCIFQGPNTYVSASLYSEPDISTWNYSAVHINAKIQMQNSQELEKSLEILIHTFEKHQEKPLYKKDIPVAMWRENFAEITGFWLNPIKIQGIHKWHRNYSREEREHIASQLNKNNLHTNYDSNEIIKNFYDSED